MAIIWKDHNTTFFRQRNNLEISTKENLKFKGQVIKSHFNMTFHLTLNRSFLIIPNDHTQSPDPTLNQLRSNGKTDLHNPNAENLKYPSYLFIRGDSSDREHMWYQLLCILCRILLV